MKALVLYHGACWDGFCAAWIAHKALVEIEAVPVQYGQDPPIDYCGRDVYILDFSYPREVMKTIIAQSNFVCVLDHHKTAQAELDGLDEEVSRESLGACHPTIRFDMNKSGGRMAWEYFYGRTEGCWPRLLNAFNGCDQQNPPWLVKYTEDRDLWRHSLPFSQEINASLRTLPLDFTAWDLLQANPDARDVMRVEGSGILRREKKIVDDHVRHAREIEMDGHKVLSVNATVLISEIAAELAKGRPFGVCWFERQDGKRAYSLRSDAKGVDVSEIAKAYGGGGHKNAAGFEV